MKNGGARPVIAKTDPKMAGCQKWRHTYVREWSSPIAPPWPRLIMRAHHSPHLPRCIIASPFKPAAPRLSPPPSPSSPDLTYTFRPPPPPLPHTAIPHCPPQRHPPGLPNAQHSPVLPPKQRPHQLNFYLTSLVTLLWMLNMTPTIPQ